MRVAAALVVAVTAFKLFLAATTYGTNDVLYWETFLREVNSLGGLGIYRVDPIFNHPPLVVRFLKLLGLVATETHVPFRFWLRACSTLADAGTFFLVLGIARATAMRLSGWTLALLAAAPASIMIAGFHGNTDPVMVFFVVLAVFLAVTGRPAWAVGLALGMAVEIKLAAIVFAPAVFFWTDGWRRRAALAGAAALLVAVASMPYLVQDPALLARKVVAYGSINGHWGFTRLLGMDPALQGAYRAYVRYGAPATIAAIAAVCFALNRRRERPPLLLQCGISGFAFMVFTPGFGVQYLDWLVPWLVAAGFASALAWHAASGVFLFTVYTFWSQRFPWYYANSLTIGDWRGGIIDLEIAAWLVTGVLLVVLLLRLPRWRTEPGGRERRPAAGSMVRWGPFP